MKAILPKKVDFFSAFGEFLFSMLFSYRDIFVTLPGSESSFSRILNRSITGFAGIGQDYQLSAVLRLSLNICCLTNYRNLVETRGERKIR